jgi:regulation of enolase protein 1 (concanavalin A-like superfamily)
MSTREIPWRKGNWGRHPQSSKEEGDCLVVEAVEGSDFWEKTLYGFQHDSGHALLAAWPETHAVEVTFALRGFTALYDQAGLMLWHGDTSWIKAGVELNDGVLQVGAVVTNGSSDWSCAPVPEWNDRLVTIRASWAKDAVIIRASATGEPWRLLRVAPFPYAERNAGPFLCAPKRSGLKVTFTNWVHTDTDADLHQDPPLPIPKRR